MTFPQHDGSIAEPGLALPIPADPAIGRLRSAATNAQQGAGGVGLFFRRLMGPTTCTYVADEGLQSFRQGATGAPEISMVRFADVDRMCARRTRVFRNGSFAFVDLSLDFYPAPTGVKEADDKPLFQIAEKVYGNPDAKVSPISVTAFADAAERAWNDYNVPRVLEAFSRTGVAEFRATAGFMVRVTPASIAAGYPGGALRERARAQLAELWIENGKLLAEPPLGNHAEVASTGNGNFAAMIILLRQLGYPLR